ncbi:ExbD/TolR family protein [Nitrincola schmidtii]|uniref:ExbD/TolR family protein n=1 Tax=Nitrincola schmidtii TaxID=1730894 RepID=UPI00124C91A0|nr:biopolymer transporter ExbD [Nitrincola schmidtii]
MQLNIQTAKRRKALSLTPLIDVVFILLLFFMLTSSFIKWHNMELAVSKPSTSTVQSSDQPPLLFTLVETGELSLRGQVYNETDNAVLAQLIDENSDASVILLTTDQVNVQQIISTIDRLKRLGAESVSLNTDR